MTTKFKKQIFFLPLLSLVISSCNGQPKIEQQSKTIPEELSFTSKKTMLTKTQGTNEYQNVHCIIEDKKGNIWLGTTGEGVYRYDGKEFYAIHRKRRFK
jgi:ligand-binding sensor domain-containing protein